MKLIVGLGNPGEKYENTRHNVGFMVVEKFVGNKSWSKSKGAPLSYSWVSIGDEKIEVIKPTTFMNKSGEAVARSLKKHPELTTSDVYVIHDDLDIKLGEWKLHFGKGPRDHKGVKSIEESLGTSEFWRVRVGVDNRDPENRIPGDSYVLMKFKADEEDVLRGIIKEIVDHLHEGVLS